MQLFVHDSGLAVVVMVAISDVSARTQISRISDVWLGLGEHPCLNRHCQLSRCEDLYYGAMCLIPSILMLETMAQIAVTSIVASAGISVLKSQEKTTIYKFKDILALCNYIFLL